MSTIKRIATGAVALGTLAAGCHSEKPPVKEAEAPVAEEEAPAVAPASEPVVAPKHGVDLAGLHARAEWAAFKTFWRKLDEVPAAAPFEKTKQGDPTAWTDELAKVAPGIEKLAADGLLGESHAHLLNALLGQRIAYLAGDCDRLMVMHRMPTPQESMSCSGSGTLETRIDLLLTLRSEGKMSDATFEAALQSVVEQLELVAVSQMLGAELGRMSGLEKTASQLMDSIRKTVAEMSDEASAGLRQTLSDAEKNLPGLRVLATDLER